MTLTSKGQVTIPQEIRNRLGLQPGTRVTFDVVGDSVRIRKAETQTRGDAIVAHLRAAGGRRGGPRLTTDQIMALTRGA
jgi:AbrB family looped-hinge helix DNA binding protein